MESLLWIGFVGLILLLLGIDLGAHRRRPGAMPVRVALSWVSFYVFLALGYSVFIYLSYEYNWLGAGAGWAEDLRGAEAAVKFFTAWLLEWSLSVDNIFVFALIFTYFKVPAPQQHRVLFWGILGALVFRGLMILAGVALIQRFEWIVYVFGGLLLLTAVRMLTSQGESVEPEKNPLVRICGYCFPMTGGYRGSAFFVREQGRLFATPLALTLLVVESTDLLFAVDSIPAAFAVTTDPFLVLTSNIFAVLGLRALYFALAGLMDKFRYLKLSLVFILAYVGVKFILSHHVSIPAWVSLTVIAGGLGLGVVASLLPAADTSALRSPPPEEMGGGGDDTRTEGEVGERGETVGMR